MTVAQTPTSTLTMAEIRQLVNELNVERARLERSLALTAGDDGDAATEARAQTASRHDAIMAAIGRVSADTYGICERCSGTIPFQRLLVMPEVTHCVDCQRRP